MLSNYRIFLNLKKSTNCDSTCEFQVLAADFHQKQAFIFVSNLSNVTNLILIISLVTFCYTVHRFCDVPECLLCSV